MCRVMTLKIELELAIGMAPGIIFDFVIHDLYVKLVDMLHLCDMVGSSHHTCPILVCRFADVFNVGFHIFL